MLYTVDTLHGDTYTSIYTISTVYIYPTPFSLHSEAADMTLRPLHVYSPFLVLRVLLQLLEAYPRVSLTRQLAVGPGRIRYFRGEQG